MKTAIFLTTVGNSDVELSGKNISKLERENITEIDGFDITYKICDQNNEPIEEGISSRLFGDYINQNHEKLKSKITCPIIIPMVEGLLKREEKIDHIFLIATDQIDEKFRAKDTLYYAEVIKKEIIRKNLCKNVHILKIRKNPTEIESMNDFWQQFFMTHKLMQDIDSSNTNFYLNIIGGVPALNYALLVNSCFYFKKNCILLSKERTSKNVYPVSFSTKIVNHLDKQKIVHSLGRYDYSSSEELFKEFGNIEYSKISKALKHRLYFDLSSSIKECDNMLKEGCSEKTTNIVRELLRDTEELKDNNNISKSLTELYVNARIKYKNEEYVDFLMRMFNFNENLMKKTIEKDLLISIKPEKYTKNIKSEKFMDLRKYLETVKVKRGDNEVPLKFDEPNRKTKQHIIRYYAMNTPENEILAKTCKVLESLDILSQIRNNSIAAHNLDAVSKDIIEEAYENGYSTEKMFLDIEEILNFKFDDNIYNKINSKISKF